MSDLPCLFNVQPSHTDLMTSHTVRWQPSETHWAAIGYTVNRRFSMLHCKQFGQILRAFINLWGCRVVFGPGPSLIWYGDTQSFPLDLSLSAAVQRKHLLSQSDAVRSKPRDAFGNAANKCTLIEMYGLMTEKHLHIHTQAHIYTQLPVCFSHTPNSIWKPSSSCREADRKAILV